MKIILNGEPRIISALSLADMLAECAIEGKVATAVNEAFIPAGLRAAHMLAEGDRIEVLAPMQGG